VPDNSDDDKSSTYKLGMLRMLCRIADGWAGMARDVEDGHVAIPLGLVALTWFLQRSEDGAQRRFAEAVGTENQDVPQELRDAGADRLPEPADILDANDFG
jgi:hypothetical protein